MSESDRDRWNAKYAAASSPGIPLVPAADRFLVEAVAESPCGRAVDLACGLGHNAIWLAQQGWQVDAVDVSSVGLEIAARLADASGAKVRWILADLDEAILQEGVYDLVTVFRFLDRQRFPEWIPRLLRQGGRLVYETFTVGELHREDGPIRNRSFLLEPGELSRLFPSLEVQSFGEFDFGGRSVARLVAERRRS